MAISEQSQRAIKDFLQVWWEDLRWKVSQTMLGCEIPIFTPEQLYGSGFGLVLRQIANAAEGQAPDTEEERGEVYEACQGLAEWMWSRPGENGSPSPAATPTAR